MFFTRKKKASWLRFPSLSRTTWALIGIFLMGFFLRIIYTAGTAYDVRSHDVEGHIEYIQYVADDFGIPPSEQGWEFYQPPLYYFLLGSYYRLWDALDLTKEQMIQNMQYNSLIFSIATLAVGMWIGFLLFASKKREHLLFSLIIATFPGLVFIAPRINNDVLYTFLAFLFLSMLIEWWQSGSWRDFYATCFIIALGILTKSNSYLFIPILFLCLLFRARLPFSKKILHGLGASVLIVIIAGWLPMYRFAIDHHASQSVQRTGSAGAALIPNLTNLHSGLGVGNGLRNYLTFNPIEIVTKPFNNAWIDENRRQYFFEYLLKSSISGEFDLGDKMYVMASQIMLLLIALLCASLLGIILSLRRETYRYLPVFFTLLFMLMGHIALRISAPYSSIQDFRYSPLLLPLLAFFTLYAIRYMPKTSEKTFVFLLGLFCYLSAQYVLTITLLGIR